MNLFKNYSDLLMSSVNDSMKLFIERAFLNAPIVLMKQVQARLSSPKKGHYIEIGYIYDDATDEVVDHYVNQNGYADKHLMIDTGVEQATTNTNSFKLNKNNLKVVKYTNSRGDEVKHINQSLTVSQVT